MENDSWSKIGSDICDMVTDAVNSQEFGKLSQAIQNTVKSYAAPQAQNPWKGNGQFEKKAAAYMGAKDLPENEFYSSAGSTRAGGYVLAVLGGVGCFCFGTGALLLLVVAASLGKTLVPFCVTLPFLAVSAFVLARGLSTLGRVKRFKNYVRVLGEKERIAISDLAASTGKSEKSTLKDVRDMISRGMFRQGQVDPSGKNLFISRQGYEAYLAAGQQEEEEKLRKLRREAAKTAYKTNDALSEEVKKTIAEGQEYIDKIHVANDVIQDEAVSRKLDGLEAVVTKIFQYVEEHPESAPETKKLMKYYLPTTIKLLDSYQKLGEQPVQGENIQKSKKEIEDTLDTLNVAFARLFDNLYQDESMDITSDISVLNTLLAQEGLTGEKM